jgi:hypothetical protein
VNHWRYTREHRYWCGIWTMRGFLYEASLIRCDGMVRERDTQRSRRR